MKSTRNVLLIVIGTCLLAPWCQVFADLPEDPGEYAKWEIGLLESVGKAKGLPAAQAIPKLGTWVMQLSQERSMNWEKGNRPVFHAAQAALLAIPGHAEYYRDRILKARAAYDEPSDEKIRLLHEWIREQEGFLVLAQLPSVENVRVLGEFLADERGKLGGSGPPPVMTEGRSMESPNCNQALSALHALPLVKKPVAGKHVNSDKDLEAYRLWYAQIKSGNRTFRFDGDPTEYDLDGPAPPEKLRRIAEHRVRDAARAERNRPDGSAAAATAAGSATFDQPTATLAGIIAAGIALVVAAWYFLRTRNRSAA